MPRPAATTTESDPVRDALEELRARLRAAGDRRAAAIAEQERADEEIADLAIRAKGILPVTEISQLVGLRTRKAVYDLIAWRSGSKRDRH
jgi:hypothetical protein